MDLYEKLWEVIETLEKRGVPYALCGSLAMTVHDFPRATLDIDILIEESSLNRAKKIAKDLGYSKDVGLIQFSEGKVKLYRLTMFDPDLNDILPLDFLLVTPALSNVWQTRKRFLGSLAICGWFSGKG